MEGGERGPFGSIKRVIDNFRMDRAEKRGDVASVDLLGDRLGLSPFDKDERLLKAYRVLVAHTEDRVKKEVFQKAEDVVSRRIDAAKQLRTPNY